MTKTYETDDSELYVVDSNGELTGENQLLALYEQVKSNVKSIPVKELLSRNVIKTNELSAVTAFISANNLSVNLFRKSDNGEELNGIIWSSIISEKANIIDFKSGAPSYSQESLNDEFLDGLKSLSTKPEELENLPRHLESAGIILVFEPTIKSSLIDGVVGKTISGRPYIGLSLRHNRLDNLWFTLFHELGHIYHHFDLLDQPILDSEDFNAESDVEIEADIFAKQKLIPRYIWNRSSLKYGDGYKESAIHEVANRVGIHPAIVAGRIRRETGNFSIHSKIITDIDTREWIWGKK
jgi:HTH-type transcriptional regulator/antitoxin HigA